jgi:hypothetical protein
MGVAEVPRWRAEGLAIAGVPLGDRSRPRWRAEGLAVAGVPLGDRSRPWRLAGVAWARLWVSCSRRVSYKQAHTSIHPYCKLLVVASRHIQLHKKTAMIIAGVKHRKAKAVASPPTRCRADGHHRPRHPLLRRAGAGAFASEAKAAADPDRGHALRGREGARVVHHLARVQTQQAKCIGPALACNTIFGQAGYADDRAHA